MSECGQLAQNPSTHHANLPRKLTRKDPLPISSTSRLKDHRTRAFAHALHVRVTKFQNTSNLYQLHPNAVLSGNLIRIPGIPLKTCRNIQRLVQGGELYWARHLKVNIDLGRPHQRKYFGVSGAISFKMPLEIHEQLTAFASIVQREMWNQGTADSFYPADVRDREHFITATGPTSISLERNGTPIGIRQPDAGLTLHGATCPFLVIEVACSESEEHVISKAKEYIRCSRGRIIYLIIISVTTTTLAKNSSISSDIGSQPRDSAEESPPLSPLTGSTPTSPSEIDRRFGIVPPGDSHQNSSIMSSTALMPDKGSRQSSEPSTYLQHTVHVWVYTQLIVPDPAKPNGEKIAVGRIIERAEVYPKKPSHKDLCFDIIWSKISAKERGQSEKKFTLYLDKLHDFAKELFRESEGDGLPGCDYPSDSQTTSGSSISFSDRSKSSHGTDSSYYPA